MFDTLSNRLDAALSKVKGRGRLDEKTVDATLKEIRLALLEADVNFKVVKGFVDRLRETLVGEEVAKALNPAQHVVRAVDAELKAALGGESAPLHFTGNGPHVIVLAGLQGSGKTTAAAKLAMHLKAKGRRPLLVACDLQRPAAVQQLRVNAEKVGVPVHAPVESGDPVPVAAGSLQVAREQNCDVIIVDTAGRLHVDEELMDQARRIREVTAADVTLFVIDAMIGQEAVNVAASFLSQVGFDGVVLSKLDGDARGGAALSVREVTGKPIMFASIGEHLDEFEAFHPDRMASRILGMGDMMTLIEKAEATYTEEEATKATDALLSGEFTLDDFLQQMQMIKKMGSLQGLLGMMPGLGKQLKDVNIDDKQIGRVEAIIRSMTTAERRDTKLLTKRGASRKRRIAAGSGTTVQEVNRLVKQFEEAKKMMQMVGKQAGLGGGGKTKGLKQARQQAAALKQLQSSGQLPSGLGGLGGGGGGLGGFKGLTQAPKPGQKDS